MIAGVLNTISVLATLIVTEGVIYFVLNLVFGKLAILNSIISQKTNIRLKHILFLLIGLFFILICFDFYKPYK